MEKTGVSGALESQKPRRKGLFIAVPIVILLALVNLLLFPFNIADGISVYLDADYGMLTHNASRILDGESLYRDIWTVYTPAADYFIAFIFQVLGQNLRSLRLVLALAAMITTVLIFLISRMLVSDKWALGITALSLLFGPVTLNFPYPTWFCIPAGLGVILAEQRAWRNNSRIGYLIAGLIGGAVFCFKPNLGLFVFASILLTQPFEAILRPESPEIRHSKLGALLSFIILMLPLMSLFLIEARFTAKHIVYFVLPAALVTATGLIAARRRQNSLASLNLSHLIYSFVGFSAAVAPMAVYLLANLSILEIYTELVYPTARFAQMAYCRLPDFLPEAGLLVFLFCFQAVLIVWAKPPLFLKRAFVILTLFFGAALFRRMLPFITEEMFIPSSNNYSLIGFSVVIYLPLAAHLALGIVFFGEFGNPPSSGREAAHLSLLLWIFSLMTFLTLYPIMEMYHLIWTMTPVMILVGYLFFRAHHSWSIAPHSFWSPWRKTLKIGSFLLIPAFLIIVFGIPILKYFVIVEQSPHRLRLREFADIHSERAGILMPASRARTINKVVDCVKQNSQPGEYIFDMSGSFFYFLTDRKNPFKWGNFAFPGFFSERDRQEVRHRLEEAKPRLIIISKASEILFSSYFPESYSYIGSRYKLLEHADEYTVLGVKDAEGSQEVYRQSNLKSKSEEVL